jgi:hypothetical protein
MWVGLVLRGKVRVRKSPFYDSEAKEIRNGKLHRELLNFSTRRPDYVIPAEAGIQLLRTKLLPAFAGNRRCCFEPTVLMERFLG